MGEKRINPDTGVSEEMGFLGWKPSENENGREERINPDTGVREEMGFLGWKSSENADGREERINPNTGVSEEMGFLGWKSSENADGREERINPDTGVREEMGFLGWKSSENADGREKRINPNTGVREEMGFLGWKPSINSEIKTPTPRVSREDVAEIKQMLYELEQMRGQTEDNECDCHVSVGNDSDESKDCESYRILSESDNESVYLTQSGEVKVRTQERTSSGSTTTTTTTSITFSSIKEYKIYLTALKMLLDEHKKDV